MKQNFDTFLEQVLKEEGGYVNHPKDPGGPTNKGVTLKNFRRFVKADGTIEDLKNITYDQIAVFYKKNYWNVVLADELPSGVDITVGDFGVNSGPSRSVKHLQRAIGAVQDGIVGPDTIHAAKEMKAEVIIDRMFKSRMEFLQGLNTWDTFGEGWANRVRRIREKSLQLAGAKPEPEVEIPVIKGPSENLITLIIKFLLALFRRS